jgi:hypothetical protein
VLSGGIPAALAGFGVLGILFGAFSFARFRLWVRECRKQRIMLAEKGKVKLDVPLTEWLAWGKQLRDDEAKGRVVAHFRGVSLAVARPDRSTSPKVTTRKRRHWRRPWKRYVSVESG